MIHNSFSDEIILQYVKLHYNVDLELGIIYSIKSNKPRGYVHTNYYHLDMYIDNRKVNVLVSRLLWTINNGTIPDNHLIDHKDKNTLNNSKDNLRLATFAQNSRNKYIRNVRKDECKYKGVYKTNSNNYIARIYYNKKNINLGTYETQEQASIAYNEKAIELFGEFASLN